MFVRLLSIVVVVPILSGLVVSAAQAQEKSEYTPTMLVLDASGSMQEFDPFGGTKVAAAKTAVHSFVAAAPAESKLGLTVYGTGSNTEKASGCTDVTVLRWVQALDKPTLNAAVDGIRPGGFAPIGAALRNAAAALPSSGPRSVVLISDGEDTCATPNPCAVAKELKRTGGDIVLHTIGFGVDPQARAQLTCIAASTGGTYTDAADGRALEQVLPRVGAAALHNYTSAGAPIIGTPEPGPPNVGIPKEQAQPKPGPEPHTVAAGNDSSGRSVDGLIAIGAAAGVVLVLALLAGWAVVLRRRG